MKYADGGPVNIDGPAIPVRWDQVGYVLPRTAIQQANIRELVEKLREMRDQQSR